ncbi:MAG: class I SAM-dependent methyltransferase [Gemmatimonadaceae bacterium]
MQQISREVNDVAVPAVGDAAEVEIRPISHWSTNDKVFELVRPFLDNGALVADIGAGEGFFSSKMGKYLASVGKDPSASLSACDLFPEYFRYRAITCDPVLMDGRLPYADSTFDVACSLEVVEHLEDQFLFTRELLRILKPGGTAIISTPNVLNINSRLRTLHSGFAVLFDPLSLSSKDPVHTSGHINPVSYYYLAYMLARAGFDKVSVEYDRLKSSARGGLTLAGPFVAIGNALFRRRFRQRSPVVEAENKAILDSMNSYKMLCARSVIAIARKASIPA